MYHCIYRTWLWRRRWPCNYSSVRKHCQASRSREGAVLQTALILDPSTDFLLYLLFDWQTRFVLPKKVSKAGEEYISTDDSLLGKGLLPEVSLGSCTYIQPLFLGLWAVILACRSEEAKIS